MKPILLLPLLGLLLAAAEMHGRRLRRALGQPPESLPCLLPDLAALTTLLLLLWPTPPAAPAAPTGAGPALALAVDVSTSMAATDTAPSRLARARAEIRALAAGLPQARFALLPFAGAPILQVPLTEDREALLFFVDQLAPGTVAAPGSAPEEAVLAAGKALQGTHGERAIILFSDGERTLPAAVPALAAGVPVFVVPLGTEKGSPVPDERGQPRRDAAGQPLLTRLDPGRLHRLATATGGEILAGGKVPAVAPLLERWAPKESATVLPASEPALALAVLLLLLRQLPFRRRSWRWAAALALALLLLPLAACNEGASRKGRSLFARADRLQREAQPAAAAALYAQAADLLAGEERAAALYNRGTLLLADGNPQAALPPLEGALLLCPGDEAIRINLALALRALGENLPPGIGEGEQDGDRGDETGMSREQALQLLESVRPDPGAPAAVRAKAREKAPARDW